MGGLTSRVAFKQSLGGGDGVLGRTFQAEGVVEARALGQGTLSEGLASRCFPQLCRGDAGSW